MSTAVNTLTPIPAWVPPPNHAEIEAPLAMERPAISKEEVISELMAEKLMKQIIKNNGIKEWEITVVPCESGRQNAFVYKSVLRKPGWDDINTETSDEDYLDGSGYINHCLENTRRVFAACVLNS